MAFDNTDNTGRNGEPKTLLDLVRDLTMSGAKLPPIFGQIVQFQGQWIQGSQALVDVLGKIGKSLLASTTTLVGAMFGSTRATNQLRQALVKLADKRDQKVADEFTEKNQGADRDAFIEARKAYRNTPGSPADKKQAARTAYEQAATKDARQKHKDARDELGDVLKKINEKSRKKASAASKKVYKSKLELYRKRGLTDDVAKRMARKKAKKVYDVAFRTAKHATPNVQRASAAASKALSAIFARIASGSVSEVSAYPRLVMETVLDYNAHSVFFCHNHPGGTCAPSAEDISTTLQLQRLLGGVDVMVLDHMIIAGANAYSMAQHGDIEFGARGRK